MSNLFTNILNCLSADKVQLDEGLPNIVYSLAKTIANRQLPLKSVSFHNDPTYVINHSVYSSIGPIVEIFLPAMRDIKMMVRKFVKPRVSIDSGMSSCSNVCHLSC